MSLKSLVEKAPAYNSLVKPLHFAQAVQAELKYDWPAKRLRVIAVTGTNGKTTTSFMIWKMLNEAGRKAGILSTVGWATGGDDLHAQVEHMTTERVEVLNERMREVAEAKAEFLVLETTSHALSQSRILGVPIEIAVFTNLAQEHLDYHKTFENYRAAKMKLFRRAKYGVINADDENAKFFESCFVEKNGRARGKYITYGIENGEMRARKVKLGVNGVEYSCSDIKVRTQIPGKFNVYNSLAAVCVGRKIGLTDKQISRGILALEAVEGRMTRVQEGQDFEVIVDYAHTPDALEKVFESVRGHEGRIIAVHGGAGRRDHGTREPRGEILGRESDIVIITEDDSRDEDSAEIAQMFVEGASRAGKALGKDLFVELDREKAIQRALMEAKRGDLVLVLGKGHEKTILRKDGAHEFEDIKVVQKYLRK